MDRHLPFSTARN